MVTTREFLTAYGRDDRGRRWVRGNVVASLDGAATHDGVAGPLGDAEDQLLLRTLRQLADVVVVGAGTVRVEGYGGLGLDDAAVTWRRARGLPGLPRLAIVSSALALEPDAEVFRAPGPRPLLLTHGDAPPARRAALDKVAEIVDCGEHRVEPARLVAALEERGMLQILTEGGPRLLGTLVEADVLDELCLSLSPLLEAGTAPRIAVSGRAVGRRMRLGHVLHGEEMLFLRYERRR